MNPIWVVLGGLCWRLTGKKIFFWYTHKAVTPKLRLAEKFANIIFTASKESFRLKSKKVIVTGHGIDTRLFQPSEKLKVKSEKLMILSVGRIAPVKNYETLINAAKILKDKNIDFSVTIVGEAPLKQDRNYELRIKNKVKKLGLEENFNFVGKINHKDLPQHYQSHDIFVHLSKTGSLDKTILEAMACEMTVLSSNDAARSFLPPEQVFSQDDGYDLAGKIEMAASGNFNRSLRQYVADNHSLSGLINKIYREIGPNRIIIYPFPYFSKSNKYTELIYKKIPGRIDGNFRFEIYDTKGSFLNLLEESFRSGVNGKKIIHIHWAHIIYGSKYVLKSVFLMAVNGTILLWLKTRNYKIVWTMHNYYGHDYPHPLIDSMGRKFMLSVADAVIVQQKKVADEFRNKHKNKVHFIPLVNYINAYGPRQRSNNEMRKNLGFLEDDIILLSLGAIKPYKKLDSIIEVFDSLRLDLDKRIKLLIVGYGNKDHCGDIGKLIGGNASVKIKCQFIEDGDVAGYLGLADYSIFWYDDSVLTSAGIMLFLSYGIPVIARDIPASDAIRDGLNGYLYANKEELTEILLRLPQKRKINPEDIIKTVSSQDSEYIAGRLAAIYKEI